jgi:hypothetical protein
MASKTMLDRMLDARLARSAQRPERRCIEDMRRPFSPLRP